MIESFIEGNKIFLEKDFERKKDRYMTLVESQHPTVLWIGCSDSRVNPERITHCRAGELFTHRNIGNIVPTHDWNFATVLEYAVRHLKVKDIVICGHSDCGALKALDVDMKDDAYIPMWINSAREAQTRVDARIPEAPKTPEEKAARKKEIEIENIRLQIEHLRSYPLVTEAEKKGCLDVHGLYYDLKTGVLSQIV
ncbi:Carbonic anhydrase 1 [Methanocorpusculaceae archaeon Sp1]|uniref:carbonic anhydrase n=1 Tax=Methanorbis furvi TaxID=3028299 RepID=A0AAE4MCW5_9EURY|nr:Carbonic anhydrase 1 [Methanocorpusculaceae archaeon Sp1]MDV0441780.1 Carbonic anhydrase 1 [Methanocorpusculaceae archaeon Ag1]